MKELKKIKICTKAIFTRTLEQASTLACNLPPTPAPASKQATNACAPSVKQSPHAQLGLVLNTIFLHSSGDNITANSSITPA